MRPSPKRRGDIDNLLKAVLDGLVEACVLLDDRFIDDLRIYRERGPCGGLAVGELRVVVDRVENGNGA